ncbi:hypothetical protein ACFSKL_16130 [Belliella marina]|uniref:Uncharacterized protein n=1 Tax=Belliella marina TaxID=1644146 RepID=A0ABW4VNH6_9BACT
MKKAFLFTIFILIIVIRSFGDDNFHSGLYFTSHEANQDYRTSLHLTPSGPLPFPNGFSIDFETKFRHGDGYFGYIYRIIGDNTYNIDLVANLNTSQTAFWLVAKDTILFGFRWDEIGGENYKDWLPIKMNIDGANNEVRLSINGVQKSGKHIFPPGVLKKLDFFFGAHKTEKFVVTDVAPMKIKNIRLRDWDGNDKAFWKLDRHRDTLVFDELNGLKAEVANPIWEINKHTNWTKLFELSVPQKLGTAINTKDSKLYIIGTKELYSIDLQTGLSKKTSYTHGGPYNCSLNTFLFDTDSNTIISYAFDHSAPSILDLETLAWSLQPEPCDLPNYWHHNRIFQKNTILTFGGYGLFTFKNQMQELNLEDQTWKQAPFAASIEPRYLAGVGQMKEDEIYIFGGYGSKSGAQHIDPHNYYDLHRVNLTTGQTDLLWDKTRQLPKHFVPVETMIPTPENDGFYTLIYDHSKYNTHLNLAKIPLENSEIVVFSDSIPYDFKDIESWCGLYYLEDSNNLVAITMTNEKFSVYGMAFPPLLLETTFQPNDSGEPLFPWEGIFFAVSLLALIIPIWFIWKRKKHTGTIKTTLENPDTSPEPIFTRQKASSLYFLGGFQAFDKNGKNITGEFTPTLRQLFLVVYFYSVNGKGISSSKLKEIIWPDKPDNSAKNNRNVNISKLRLILEKIGNLHIDCEESYWKIHLDIGVYSDYEEIMSLIDGLKTNPNHQHTHRLINLLASGDLCPNVQTDWMDNFKVAYSNLAIDTLFGLLNSGNIGENQHLLRLSVAEALLIHDMLNEEALKIKCQVLFLMGKNGLALQAYEKFAKDYERMMGVAYQGSVGSIL